MGDVAAGAVPIGLLCVAGGYGMVASTIPMIARASFPPSEFKARFALIFSAWGVAGLCAPSIAGLLFDATGTFDVAYLVAAISVVLFAGSGRALVKELK